ncbi:MAG: 30S ribosomal protein S20 [Bacteroidales bacterium]|nr:30S ribosomal protein S20 [Bacteroidales bacterium]
MAHHHSAKKKINQDEARRLRNRYYAVTMRNAVRKIRATKEKEEAEKALPGVTKMIDKLAKKHVIHKNKAANLKSELQLLVNKL